MYVGETLPSSQAGELEELHPHLPEQPAASRPIEHGGAEQGLLILSRGAEQRIAAKVMTGGAAVVVQMRDDRLRPAVLPESVFNHVLRTQDIVNLDAASAENPYSAHARLNRGHQSFRYRRNDAPIGAARWWATGSTMHTRYLLSLRHAARGYEWKPALTRG